MSRAAVAIVIFAFGTRLLRAGLRWEEWALHYAAYNLAAQNAFQSQNFLTLLDNWVGLHPPLYPAIHAFMNIVWPTPAFWLIFSGLCSALAVMFLLLAHPRQPLPGLLLATDPVQLHYAAEVNNYPLSVLIISATWWALKTNRTKGLVAFTILGMWTHVFAGFVCLIMAIAHPKRKLIIGCVTLMAAPLASTAWGLASDLGTRSQPPLNLELSLQDALSRFGFGWVALLPLLLLGATKSRHAALVWGASCFFWAFMVWLGIAAPHQFPYALFLSVPAAVLLTSASRQSRAVGLLVIVVGSFRGLWSGGQMIHQSMDIRRDFERERGIDTVLNLSLPGDAIVLVRGPGAPDDDKRRSSPTLWRLSPFEPMPALFTQVRPDLVGQPRLYRGRRIYTFSHPRPSIGEIPGQSVFTVLYDGAEQNIDRIPSHPMQGAWQSSGPDLWRGP